MELQQIHTKLSKECPTNYRVNEIIRFAYPYRRVKVNATVNKSPEESIRQIYSVLLRAIQSGMNKEKDLTKFLGLDREDFLLRELYFLKEKGYLDLTSSQWMITSQGKEFIKDHSKLRILEEEVFEFLIDGLTELPLPKEGRLYHDKSATKQKLPSLIRHNIRSEELLNNKLDHITDVYNQTHRNKSFLVDVDQKNLLFDKEEYNDYYLIEYIPEKHKENELDPFIEVRHIDKDISKHKGLSKSLNERYPQLLYDLSESDRGMIADSSEEETSEIKPLKLPQNSSVNTTLSVWQMQDKFKEALVTAKKGILVESPWIKKATLNYLKDIERLLANEVTVVFLYGIEFNDTHDQATIDKLKKLQASNKDHFHLIHLPTHFNKNSIYDMSGTHRKLLIKDIEYYLSGSFNFLSFNKKEGQKVANEEGVLISTNGYEKWESVFKEYNLDLSILDHIRKNSTRKELLINKACNS